MNHRKGLEGLRERAEASMMRRLEEKRRRLEEYERRLKEREEELSFEVMEGLVKGNQIEKMMERILRDRMRLELERELRRLGEETEDLSVKDLEEGLKEFVEEGLIELENERIRITPKGAKRLAREVLSRIMKNLRIGEGGVHEVEEVGFGADLSTSSRKIELGDDYNRIDLERTLLSSLEREGRIHLRLDDFHVYEEKKEVRMCCGLIIDESGSMSGDKLDAAIDAALALSELIKRDPKDKLKVYLFSNTVREVPQHEIVNVSFAHGSTDIRGALYAFRKAIINERGEKQAYIITDTEPNTEDGRYVGFKDAIRGVLREAVYYREAGITLNIIMLDSSPHLKELASMIARKNLGRVFFTSPTRLGELVVEDYLRTKKGAFFW